MRHATAMPSKQIFAQVLWMAYVVELMVMTTVVDMDKDAKVGDG